MTEKDYGTSPVTASGEIATGDRRPSIVERLKKARGPDRELDRDIAEAVGWQRKVGAPHEDDYWRIGDYSWTREDNEHPPRYTESVDSALTLIPSGLFWLIGCGKTRPDEPLYAAQIIAPDGAPDKVISEAESDASAATALCIAALEAAPSQTQSC